MHQVPGSLIKQVSPSKRLSDVYLITVAVGGQLAKEKGMQETTGHYQNKYCNWSVILKQAKVSISHVYIITMAMGGQLAKEKGM